jgi:hypothetical protein
MLRDEDDRYPTLPGATSEECNDSVGKYPSSNHHNCFTCDASGIDVKMDIDNPRNYYCIKCWDAYNAVVAYHRGTSDFNRLAEVNSFRSTQNSALIITVASLIADMDKMQMKERLHMDKMKEQLGRLWKENSRLLQDRLVPIYISDGGLSSLCRTRQNELLLVREGVSSLVGQKEDTLSK